MASSCGAAGAAEARIRPQDIVFTLPDYEDPRDEAVIHYLVYEFANPYPGAIIQKILYSASLINDTMDIVSDGRTIAIASCDRLSGTLLIGGTFSTLRFLSSNNGCHGQGALDLGPPGGGLKGVTVRIVYGFK